MTDCTPPEASQPSMPSSSLPESTLSAPVSRPPMKERPKQDVNVFMGGFLFDVERIRLLCIKHFNFSPTMVDEEGPLEMGNLYFNQLYAFDSPSFIPIIYRSRGPPTVRRQAYLLVCRLAYVALGKERPDLGWNAAAERYIERWFPKHLRELPEFKDLPYAQFKHPNIPCEGCVKRKLNEHDGPGRLRRVQRLLRWLEREMERGRTYRKSDIPPLLPAEYVINW